MLGGREQEPYFPSFSKHLLSTFYAPATIFGTGDVESNKTLLIKIAKQARGS